MTKEEYCLKINNEKNNEKLHNQIVLFFKRKNLNYTEFNVCLGLDGDDFVKNKLTLMITIS